jgi:hypothetical protein
MYSYTSAREPDLASIECLYSGRSINVHDLPTVTEDFDSDEICSLCNTILASCYGTTERVTFLSVWESRKSAWMDVRAVGSVSISIRISIGFVSNRKINQMGTAHAYPPKDAPHLARPPN